MVFQYPYNLHWFLFLFLNFHMYICNKLFYTLSLSFVFLLTFLLFFVFNFNFLIFLFWILTFCFLFSNCTFLYVYISNLHLLFLHTILWHFIQPQRQHITYIYFLPHIFIPWHFIHSTPTYIRKTKSILAQKRKKLDLCFQTDCSFLCFYSFQYT